jgi:hypothetical protein
LSEIKLPKLPKRWQDQLNNGEKSTVKKLSTRKNSKNFIKMNKQLNKFTYS